MDVCTLGDLTDVLGSPALRLRAAPAGSTAQVTEVVLHDAHAPLPHTPGALLLAVGVRAAAAGPLVKRAADAGMTGVVVRGTDAPVAEAEAYGVALLTVEEDAAWHHVHLMLASAIDARRAHGAGLGSLFALADAIAAATASGCSSGMKCPALGTTTPVVSAAQGLMEAAMSGIEPWLLDIPRTGRVRGCRSSASWFLRADSAASR